ncbi:probable protein phosphatase 2C 8 [Salvia splendens]|uniref:probable protein phosphatase 2C 8 n=1 Tax=Salvia splendens TaxID=180675 RepID=UPI001C25404D|nr:probable protein phosphatase 2C 8 [Salvia splendens]
MEQAHITQMVKKLNPASSSEDERSKKHSRSRRSSDTDSSDESDVRGHHSRSRSDDKETSRGKSSSRRHSKHGKRKRKDSPSRSLGASEHEKRQKKEETLGTMRSHEWGDSYLKPYVIPEPEVTVTDRTAEDECLILASYGLWDIVSDQTACGVARMCLQIVPYIHVVEAQNRINAVGIVIAFPPN